MQLPRYWAVPQDYAKETLEARICILQVTDDTWYDECLKFGGLGETRGHIPQNRVLQNFKTHGEREKDRTSMLKRAKCAFVAGTI